ncbi:exosortase T [Sinimarinibacterium sp. CAU 1509]|uniref:exosortase T n=1 Tax=Sinimarinibacterium sp. CAU 1509 TaxID=2562283 RepID=UPI00146BE08A|nr:exosortase T [Sinimarinibacterium sp. CAU 1509]
MRSFGHQVINHLPLALLALGAGVLAVSPLLWLLASWREPAYNPQGLWVALAVLALGLWSYSSEQRPGSDQNRRYAYALLTLSALVRLVGQVLRVNVIGALTLAVDVYALATLAGLRQRQRAVSPLWLSLLFAFSLPLERVVQRLIGFGLQQLSADGACLLLGQIAGEVHCVGTRILIAGQDVLVDLPCSGARGLTLVLTVFVGLAAVVRPNGRQAVTGFALALSAALLGNILRIALLALGLAYWPQIDWMDGFWHALPGLAALTLALLPLLPLLAWARRVPPQMPRIIVPAPSSSAAAMTGPRGRPTVFTAIGFLLVALGSVSAPARPLDVSHAAVAAELPARIGGYAAQTQSLSAMERSYFAQYGGAAAKAGYGPFGLLTVTTTAPLRHLHAPDECLRGAGHRVDYLGLDYRRAGSVVLPSALYRSVDPDGRVWRVAVSYVSDRGEVAGSVAEAVWRWLQAPGSTWTQLQRVTPWSLDPAARADWDAALLRAYDLPGAEPAQTGYRVADAR